MAKAKTVREFFVAMRPGSTTAATAACVADDEPTVKEFFRDYAGCEIRRVNSDEVARLMTTR